jgi:hypothetical protein
MSRNIIFEECVFGTMVPCRSCVNRRFGLTYRFHLQGRKFANEEPAWVGDCRLSIDAWEKIWRHTSKWRLFKSKQCAYFRPILWPPRSSDKMPLDLFLWGHVKDIVYKTPVTSPWWTEAQNCCCYRNSYTANVGVYLDGHWIHAKKGAHVEVV